MFLVPNFEFQYLLGIQKNEYLIFLGGMKSVFVFVCLI